jgi:hypothetical protein|tara:strand:+ start:16 stop:465 length:450 start_codon:yes stop_codon:yes gene_type:complete
MLIELRVKVPLKPFRRELTVNSNCTGSESNNGKPTLVVNPFRWGFFTARKCEMEAASEPQHQTRVNSRAGWAEWVSKRQFAMPNILMCQHSIKSGRGGKFFWLTLRDLYRSTMSGRSVREDVPMSIEKSDHLIVVMKPSNVGGAKGVTD